MRKLPDKLILALARYYNQRTQANAWRLGKALQDLCLYAGVGSFHDHYSGKQQPQFDKQGCLDRINAITRQCGIHFAATAGTFWFTKKCRNGEVVFQVNESNYLDSGKRIYKRRESK